MMGEEGNQGQGLSGPVATNDEPDVLVELYADAMRRPGRRRIHFAHPVWNRLSRVLCRPNVVADRVAVAFILAEHGYRFNRRDTKLLADEAIDLSRRIRFRQLLKREFPTRVASVEGREGEADCLIVYDVLNARRVIGSHHLALHRLMRFLRDSGGFEVQRRVLEPLTARDPEVPIPEGTT